MPRYGPDLVWRLARMCAAGAVCVAAMVVVAGGPAPAPGDAPVTRPSSAPAASGAAFEAFYRRQLQDLKPEDVEGIYGLAVQCAANNRPDLAAGLCQRLLQTWPSHARATELLATMNKRLAAVARSAVQPAQPPIQPGSVLNAQGMNRLRFWEFNPNDMTDRLRVRIPRQVAVEFADEMTRAGVMARADRAAFERADNDDKLRVIVEQSGERYVDRVEILSDPRALVAFRQKIWPIISKGCAAPTCHGRSEGPKLRFLLPGTHVQAAGTNFYIATGYQDQDGRLIDRERPEMSLLLQHGLPGQVAQGRHPTPILPVYVGKNDAKYRAILDWIRSLRAPQPDYGITEAMWQRPGGPTGAPATAAAGASQAGSTGAARAAPASRPAPGPVAIPRR